MKYLLSLFILCLTFSSIAQSNQNRDKDYEYKLIGTYMLDSSVVRPVKFGIVWSESDGGIEGKYYDDYFADSTEVVGSAGENGRTFTVNLPKEITGVKTIHFLTAQRTARDTAVTVPLSVVTRDVKGNPLTTSKTNVQFLAMTSPPERGEEVTQNVNVKDARSVADKEDDRPEESLVSQLQEEEKVPMKLILQRRKQLARNLRQEKASQQNNRQAQQDEAGKNRQSQQDKTDQQKNRQAQQDKTDQQNNREAKNSKTGQQNNRQAQEDTRLDQEKRSPEDMRRVKQQREQREQDRREAQEGGVVIDEFGREARRPDPVTVVRSRNQEERQEDEGGCTEYFGELAGFCGIYEGLISEERDPANRCNLLAGTVQLELNNTGHLLLHLGENPSVVMEPVHSIGRIPANPGTNTIDVISRSCRPLAGTKFPNDSCKLLNLTGTFTTETGGKHFQGTYTITDEEINQSCRYGLSMDREI